MDQVGARSLADRSTAFDERPGCWSRFPECTILLLLLRLGLALTSHQSFLFATAQLTGDCSSDLISSDQLKSGTITSPNYGSESGYPSNVVCRYRFYAADRERVRIEFADFDLNYPDGDASHPKECSQVDFLNVDDDHVTTTSSRIGVYCGRRLPPAIMSGPSSRLMVTFVSRPHSSGAGFSANYSFVTDFGIRFGEQDTIAGCRFKYRSSARCNGTISSPNYPGLYPRNTECTYVFVMKLQERVTVTFRRFDIEGIMPKCSTTTQSDYLEVTGLTFGSSKRYCWTAEKPLPAPVTATSDSNDRSELRLTFQSDDVFDATGFEAVYEFSTFVPSTSGSTEVSWNKIPFVFAFALFAINLHMLADACKYRVN